MAVPTMVLPHRRVWGRHAEGRPRRDVAPRPRDGRHRGRGAHRVTELYVRHTPDLDVNVTLPVIWTSLDLEATSIVPDPRFPSFALKPGSPLAGTDVLSASAESAGVGDLLLRAKYIVRRGAPADIALGLGLSLPTGSADNFQGTGTTRVLPALIASRVFG